MIRLSAVSRGISYRCASRRLATAAGNLPNTKSPIVSKLKYFNSVQNDGGLIPTFRVLDSVGKPIDGAELPEIDEKLARRMYENMQLLPTLDNVLYNVQRQGKISFYMTSHGEEATIIGSAAALASDDELGYPFPAILSILMHFTRVLEDTSGKGRQMPVVGQTNVSRSFALMSIYQHFGSTEHHFHTISSPLSTQIPQAAGVGYALRRSPARRGRSIAACYFGEGAASEGDFHAGLLLASTIPSPTLYIARNNGFAISTPSTEQYYGDGIASRGPGYGIDTVRVDGNDVLAVLAAVREGRRRCLEQGRAAHLSTSVGHHSTSDDSFAYRARSEVEDRKRIDNPIVRFRLFMESQGWWNAEAEEELKARLKADVMTAFRRAESLAKPEVGELFTDVYGGEQPWNIKEQREELTRLLKKYGQVWEPWRTELARFKNNGQDLLKP
ncbi:hypothetical protein H0H92_009619 [Tricholoma furcatifolium]|nr:hypothetical protein H0H92_009619 [Tricholoma furcatifolium]